MTYETYMRLIRNLLILSMLPFILVACQKTLSTGISPSGKGVATACDLLNDVDVRASRKDTVETQRTLYILQQDKAKCTDGRS